MTLIVTWPGLYTSLAAIGTKLSGNWGTWSSAGGISQDAMLVECYPVDITYVGILFQNESDSQHLEKFRALCCNRISSSGVSITCCLARVFQLWIRPAADVCMASIEKSTIGHIPWQMFLWFVCGRIARIRFIEGRCSSYVSPYASGYAHRQSTSRTMTDIKWFQSALISNGPGDL
jgi:hypothetical protein